MGNAKDLVVKPIAASDANAIVRKIHYSGKVVNNSQLHLGVFLNGKCGGAMQFGPSMDKRKAIGLVPGTGWNDFFELNRMAFADWLPRNSESRCIAYAMRFIKRRYPNKEWVLSYADGSQCGDGTIYRASGFLLTGIGKNTSMLRMPDGKVYATLPITNGGGGVNGCALRRKLCKQFGIPYYSQASVKPFLQIGAEFVPGFQLRYIYFLNKKARERLSVPVLPFSEIHRHGAGMYKGKPRVRSVDGDTTASQAVEGGSNPTRTLS